MVPSRCREMELLTSYPLASHNCKLWMEKIGMIDSDRFLPLHCLDSGQSSSKLIFKTQKAMVHHTNKIGSKMNNSGTRQFFFPCSKDNKTSKNTETKTR